MRSLIEISDLKKEEIFQIFELANHYLTHGISENLSKLFFSLFLESSTRTETSFLVAAKRLGCTLEKIEKENLATKKGESLKDLILNLLAMGPDFIVIRHPESRALDNFLKDKYCTVSKCGIINAGDGKNQHPTQSLIDAFTILKQKEKIEGLNVLICGDIVGSRVAHSDIEILNTLGANVSVVLHPAFCKSQVQKGVSIKRSMKDGLQDADVVIMLRMQQERKNAFNILSNFEYKDHFYLDKKKLEYAKDDILIMHPGPVNRGVEISSDVLELKNSAVLRQVEYGVFIRAAVISFLSCS